MNKAERIERLAGHLYGYGWDKAPEEYKSGWRSHAKGQLDFLATLGAVWVSDENSHPRDYDQCYCGDYRHQHENGTGKCRMPDDLCHGMKPCLTFRLAEACDIPAGWRKVEGA